MDRENFYLILELSVDPPEENLRVIAEAISKKQAEWSRYRNHPTKGIQAKKYIDLILKIRQVMEDPDLRKKEVQEAREILRKRRQKKLSELDRHLTIRMAKGYITDEEMNKLSKLHIISINEIRRIVKKKQEDRFNEIDKHIGIRMVKGYILEEEIKKLAKLHSISESQLRKRVKCPVSEKGNRKVKKIKPLDEAVEKAINDNLKIVGKSSLYDFLDLPSGSELKIIQNEIKKKEADFFKSAKKDAVITANNSLAGLCKSIFKTNTSRTSYDITRARVHLMDIHSDIDMAGMEGSIRSEYFEALTRKTSAEFGMENEEAAKYIREYCRRKKITIRDKKDNKPALKNKKSKSGLIIILSAFFIITITIGILFWMLQSSRIEDEYQAFIVRVENQKNLEEKEKLINDFIILHNQNKIRLKAEKKLNEIQGLIKKRDYKIIVNNGNKLVKAEKYQEAIEFYKNYFSKFSDSPYITELEGKIAQIHNLIEARDYKKLKALVGISSFERIKIYNNYLKKYPKAKYKKDVEKFIINMSEEYYVDLMKKITICQNNEEWKKCLRLCSTYIEIYKDTTRALEFKILQDNFRKKIGDKLVLASLIRNAELKGDNYEAAKEIYLNYLKSTPDSTLIYDIKKELDKLDEKEKKSKIYKKKLMIRALLKKSKKRFVEKKDNILIDTQTNLMWSMLDSQDALKKCLNYDSALKYATDLKIGGYDDWRLPSSDELAQIYKTRPFFPSVDTRWYWTSESYKEYSDGWRIIVNIVNSKKELIQKKENKYSWECGAVRTVRP
ncbi:DUF1566 domain-containing protein [Candidatus Magnetomoraceae bacterium gMMP-15]